MINKNYFKKIEFLIIKLFYNRTNFDGVILEVGEDEINPSIIAKYLESIIDCKHIYIYIMYVIYYVCM